MIPQKGVWVLPMKAERPSAPRSKGPQQKGWVGGQKEGGFGGSPPKIDSHFHAQCRVGGQKEGGDGFEA